MNIDELVKEINKKQAVIIYNEIDGYTEVTIDGGRPSRFDSIKDAAFCAGLRGATEVEVRELSDGDMLVEVLVWFRKGQARYENQEAQAARWSRRAFNGKGARQMGRDRFGRFRGLAIEY
jgi:hypothetical protein